MFNNLVIKNGLSKNLMLINFTTRKDKDRSFILSKQNSQTLGQKLLKIQLSYDFMGLQEDWNSCKFGLL